MRQKIVAATDGIGRFKCVNELSKSALNAGITRQSVVGMRLWDFVDAAAASPIREKFAACLLDGTDQHYRLTSKVHNTTEHWETHLMRCEGAEMVAVSVEVFPGLESEITTDDRRVLCCLAEDMPIEDIGCAMGISGSCIGVRLKRLRDKVGVRTNHGLLGWAMRHGIIS
jgi:DNA-binding CsgD family transcriptional regulator